jgi:hypothetical protein
MSFVLIVLMTVFTNAKATDFHVANGATDTELAAVLSQATTGDVIWIDGTVTMNAPVEITKNVTIKGVDGAYFDGGEKTRLFEIHPEAIPEAKLTFENLGFTGGNGALSTPTDGGVARIYDGGTIDFKMCWFDANTAYRGGAFFITPGDLGAPTITFTGCEATNNIAYGNGGESRGGYLFVDGDNVKIDHEYCKISGNKSIGGRGGALCLFGNNTRRFYYCVIADNWGGNWGEDPSGITSDLVKMDYFGNVVTDGEYEGGVAFITGGATTFEACGIIANKSWSHSGIIRGWGDANTTVTFINCTLAKNQSLHDRSPLWIGGSATYTLVNSFLVDNLGQNQGNGAGFDFDGANVKLNVFNSVIARNVAGADGAVDIRNAADYSKQLTVKNSLIGLIQGNSSVVIPQDNPNIPTKSNIAMYKLADEQASLDYATLENSGIDFGQGIKYSKYYGMPYYLLQDNSTVTKLGDPSLLGEYDITTDLFGRIRDIAADGSISAAPTLASTQDEYDDTPTAVNLPKSGKAEVKLINSIVENGILGIDFGEMRGLAKGELYSVTGQKVETVFSCNVVGKGYYNVKTSIAGIYLLKVTIEGKSIANRLIIK